MTSKSSFIDFKFGFVILTTLVSIKFWSFTAINDNIYDYLEVIILIGLFYYIFTSNTKYKELAFKNNVLLFVSIPIVSAIGAFIFHDQSIKLSALVLRTNFFWLLYFVLHLFDIPVKKVIYLLVFVGLVWVILTVVQQFTYPVYYFSTKNEEHTYYFLRAGVYRFMLNRHHYGLFIVLYFFYKYMISRKVGYGGLALIGLIGFYYYGTRQFALAVLVCMACSIFFLEGRAKILALASIFVGAIVLFLYKDVLFGDYLEMTNNQLENEDDIRLVAANFFFFEYWPHWLTKVIGNGIPHSLSNYGQEMDSLKEDLRLFRSDIGIIGAYNQFGFFYVLNIIWLNIKGLQSRYYTYKTNYLKLFFINALLLLFISEYYANASAIPFFCFILYLVDKSAEEKSNLYS